MSFKFHVGSLFVLSSSLLAFAQPPETQTAQQPLQEDVVVTETHEHHEYRDHRHDRFMLGACVGQSLAAQGITLPFPKPEGTTMDPSTQTAMRTAVETCRAQMEGAQPSPSVSPSASPSGGLPSGTPSTAPSVSPTPVESPTPAPSYSGL